MFLLSRNFEDHPPAPVLFYFYYFSRFRSTPRANFAVRVVGSSAVILTVSFASKTNVFDLGSVIGKIYQSR